jgi:cation diffusion facilitator family transporter
MYSGVPLIGAPDSFYGVKRVEVVCGRARPKLWLRNMMREKNASLPCPFMRMIVRRVIRPDEAPDSHENRTRLGMLAGWTSVVLSIVLALVKAWLGLVSGSLSLLADATNNFTDAISSLMIALSFQWSRKPRDEKHPFGHGRIEVVATLVMAIALILVGVEVAKSGIARMIQPQPIEAPAWVLVTVGATLIVKSWLALFARGLARYTRSHTLEVDAWNHLFDIVCTVLVLAALVSSGIGWGSMDALIAIGVALYILYTGIIYAREAIDKLLGEKPDAEIVRHIYKTILGVEGVMGAHEIMVHQYGDVHMVSFHIEVDANMTLLEAHALTERVEDVVENQTGWRAVAHTDPIDRSHPLFDELNHVLKEYIAAEPRLVDVHDLRAEGEREPFRVSFDLVTDIETPRTEYDAINNSCRQALQAAFKDRVRRAEIGIEAAVESAPMSRTLVDL